MVMNVGFEVLVVVTVKLLPLFDLPFDSADGSSAFLQNVAKPPQHYTTSHPRR
jgi:hypothetical protein